jgi:hypothetical protein
MVPNDLLLYWEKQALAQERAQLERETREALENQRILREQLERERQEMQQRGNYQQLIERQTTGLGGEGASRVGDLPQGMGRGRGRGLSNLPAWLVEKQRKEAETAAGDNNDAELERKDGGRGEGS